MSDGRDVPELRRLLQEALSAEMRPGTERGAGRMQPMDSEHAAYVFLLRDAAAAFIGAESAYARNE